MNALIALYNAQRFAEVESQARRLTGRFPDAALLWKLLGASLQMQGRDALAAFQKAAELMPGDAEAHNNLGSVFQERGQLDDALASYRSALKIDPRFVEAHYNLGNALSELGRLEEAVDSYRSALKFNPNIAVIHSNLGAALQELGRIDEAISSCRRALELEPGLAVVHSNLLGMLNSTSGHTPAQCLEEARKYGKMVSQKVSSRFSTWQCADSPERLRVGMVSGDLHNHPVGYFLESLLANLDPARVELIAYSTNTTADALTNRIKPYFTAWKPLQDLGDDAAARLIHADGVHVLLDLAGHTEQNRLPIFAWKPAPVQVSWLGYFATTGMAEMDYLLADRVGVPESQRKNFTETVWYLPDTRLCFTAPAAAVPVAPLPALQNGYLTFGCFQNLSKVGDEVLAAWGKHLCCAARCAAALAIQTTRRPGGGGTADVAPAAARHRSGTGVLARQCVTRGLSGRAWRSGHGAGYVPIPGRHHHLRGTVDGRADNHVSGGHPVGQTRRQPAHGGGTARLGRDQREGLHSQGDREGQRHIRTDHLARRTARTGEHSAVVRCQALCTEFRTGAVGDVAGAHPEE